MTRQIPSLNERIERYLSAVKYSLSPSRKLEAGLGFGAGLLKVHNLGYKLAIAVKWVEKPEQESALEFYVNNTGDLSYGYLFPLFFDSTLDLYKERIMKTLDDTLGKEHIVSRAFHYLTSNTHRQNWTSSGLAALMVSGVELAGISNYSDLSDVPAIWVGAGLYSCVRSGMIELFELVRAQRREKVYDRLLTFVEAVEIRKGPIHSKKSRRKKKFGMDKK